MFGGKFQQHFNNAKLWGHNAYHQVRKFGNDVNRGVNIAKKVYAVMEPVISSFVGDKAHKHIMNAVSSYDNIKHKLTEGHNNIENNIHKVKKAIKIGMQN